MSLPSSVREVFVIGVVTFWISSSSSLNEERLELEDTSILLSEGLAGAAGAQTCGVSTTAQAPLSLPRPQLTPSAGAGFDPKTPPHPHPIDAVRAVFTPVSNVFFNVSFTQDLDDLFKLNSNIYTSVAVQSCSSNRMSEVLDSIVNV